MFAKGQLQTLMTLGSHEVRRDQCSARAKARIGAGAIQNRVKWRSGNLRRVFPIGFDGTRRARDE
jgi:hypothetical protein